MNNKSLLKFLISCFVMTLSFGVQATTCCDEDFTDEGFYKFCDMRYESGVGQIVLQPRTKKEKLTRPPR